MQQIYARIKKLSLVAMVLAPALGVAALVTAPVAMADTKSDAAAAVKSIDSDPKATGKDTTKLPAFIKNVISILLTVIGIIAVIMIIVGGIRYTTSNGDSSQTTAAKNTILYAVVGLVVAIMAFAIVNWVMGRV